MKTYLEYLSSLPKSVADKAIANLQADFPEKADTPCESLEHAILTGFVWTTSPEGLVHWAGIHYALTAGEFDTDIPKPHHHHDT